jgi:CRISPR/Cas system CSM-associated protein Csm3 (group 7 of RAMP superfamily)
MDFFGNYVKRTFGYNNEIDMLKQKRLQQIIEKEKLLLEMKDNIINCPEEIASYLYTVNVNGLKQQKDMIYMPVSNLLGASRNNLEKLDKSTLYMKEALIDYKYCKVCNVFKFYEELEKKNI